MDEGEFSAELDRHIDRALEAAERSPDARGEEPALVAIVNLVRDHIEFASTADEVFADLVQRLGETPGPLGLVEPLEYCVHALELPRVLKAAETLRAASLIAYDKGPSARPWEHARRCERVLAASQPDWDGQDVYPSLAE